MPEEIIEIEEKSVKRSVDKKEYICKTCKWWTRCRPLPGQEELWGLEMFHFGECRAMPPTALGQDKKIMAPNDSTGKIVASIKLSRFPHTNVDDWCGQWSAKS